MKNPSSRRASASRSTSIPRFSAIRCVLALCAFLALAAANLSAAELLPPVQVQGGLVQGVVEDGLTVYRGIPFAAPPLGDLRWRAPQPLKPWKGILQAKEFAASPMQRVEAWMGPLHVSEDCLYLNVWTPAKPSGKPMPVMVWIYGGGFTSGSTAIRSYSGEQLAKHGVVVVSIAYRVGQMGYLALPELSRESPQHVSGNYGMLDQIAGLQWVQKNIAAFGGDPHKVTIFGESAGGISVSILAASPLAKGLFQGAISESGGSFGPSRTPSAPGENIQTLANAEQQGEAFEKQLGAASLAELRKIPADKIQTANGARGEFWPVLDNWVIRGDQYELYEQGLYNDTPILVGTNSDEGALFGTPPSREAYIDSVKQRFGPFADKLFAQYPASEAEWRQSNMNVMRDAGFAWPTWAWAKLQAKTGKSKVFMYYFDHVQPRSAGLPWKNAIGAVHSEEMVYVFQHLNQSPELPWSDVDRSLSDDMARYWTNFAKSGDPNGEGLPTWPEFSADKAAVMHFTDTPQAGDVPNLKKLEILDAYFAWRRTPAGKKFVQ